ncbi:hypothetical protein RJ639_011260 [Escallonia herrerae]|uniref:MADS-box domain-containing protein n=1 Tax=Escallonia herrerae TaxID=1293975 RepID=A0AA89AR48_9ASTE|nr:hypothetical protein RJ639_011260 [Escallonia herrerae]
MSLRSTTTTRKTSQGRKKIEIKKIEEINSRAVTFSKRRSGLFKKASELCVLTGAEAAIVVQSPGGRAFAFGHPNAEAIMDRYLTGKPKAGPTKAQPDMREFNQHYNEVSMEVEKEKRRKEIIKESRDANPSGLFWWEEPVDGLGLDEMDLYIRSLEELKKNVEMRADELAMVEGSAVPLPPAVGPLINHVGMVAAPLVNGNINCEIARAFRDYDFDLGHI